MFISLNADCQRKVVITISIVYFSLPFLLSFCSGTTLAMSMLKILIIFNFHMKIERSSQSCTKYFACIFSPIPISVMNKSGIMFKVINYWDESCYLFEQINIL